MFHARWLTSILLGAVLIESQAFAQETETSSITFPEDGAGVPHSNMPEGGVISTWPEPEKTPDSTTTETPTESQPPETGTSSLEETKLLPAEDKMSIGWHGYLRTVAEAVQDDALPFIGRNNGFRLADARIGILARANADLFAYIWIETALARAEDLNDPNAQLSLGLRDAYVSYRFSERAEFWVGRFKAPYDLGALESTRTRTFIDSPLESRGVLPTHGLETRGMSPGRQLGISLLSPKMNLTQDGFDVGYALALTNGRTDGLVLNDNNSPAVFGRLSLLYSDWASLNVAGFLDSRTVGELPNLFDEDVKGAEVSLQLDVYGLKIEAQGLLQKTQFATSGRPDITSYGAHAQWAYRICNIEAAYRFAYFDPNTDFDLDQVFEHTVALSYFVETVPLRFSINGTLSDEVRELTNNRLAALIQYTF